MANSIVDNDAQLTISVVTSARNMQQYVGQTISSVVAQKLANDQYIFVDAASTDGTTQVAKSFGNQIDTLISEPDDGQYFGIAKGFRHATGDIQCWINADDILMPWTFAVVREIFTRFPEVDWITGNPSFLQANGQLTRMYTKMPAYPRKFIANGWFDKNLGGYLQQESMFWRKSLWDKTDGLNLDLLLAADFDLWTKFAEHAELVPVDIPLAAFRERPGEQRSSSQDDEYLSEVRSVCATKPPAPVAWQFASRRGIKARSFARLLASAKGPAISYNRRKHAWTKTVARRSISRMSVATLIEEWRMDQGQ